MRERDDPKRESDEVALLRAELRRVHQKLSGKVFELHNLFDISRDLTGSSAEEAIQSLTVTAAMGHFVVSRCALYLCGPRGLLLAHGRGLRRERGGRADPARRRAPGSRVSDAAAGRSPSCPTARSAGGWSGPAWPSPCPSPRGRAWKACSRSGSARPGCRSRRRTGRSPRPWPARRSPRSRTPACSASARRSCARTASCRSRARSSRACLPPRPPEVAGLRGGRPRAVPASRWAATPTTGFRSEAGASRSSIADVAGKGTPASLLMASVHAFVHALAGTAAPAQVVERLNRFLFARTQASRFVTLFYAELDARDAPARLRQRRPRPALPRRPRRDA